MSRQNRRYAARLLKLDAILASVPNEQYDHSLFLKTDDPASCNTIGCAMGHAVANAEKFPGLKVRYNGPGLPSGKTFSFGPIGEKDYSPVDYTCNQRIGMHDWANHYFGPGTYDRIFDTDPYRYTQPGNVKEAVRSKLRSIAAEFEKA